MAVIKVIELVGTSPQGWDQAAREVVTKASETVHNIVGLEVVGHTAVVMENKITEFRANVKIAFVVD